MGISLDELIKNYKETDGMPTGTNKNKEAFKKEFKTDRMFEKFCGACASVMCISTVTGISLEDVFEMYVAEMRKELESDDTKALMEIGKLISGFVDKLD